MRSFFASLTRRLPFVLPLLLLVACGGTGSGTPASNDERPPATPLPSEQASTDGPTGYITLLSVDDYVFAVPRFTEKTTDAANAGSRKSCELQRRTEAAASEPEVSAGTLTFTIPTRSGEQTFEATFDPKQHSYEPASVDARVEVGALLKVNAEGDAVPAFDAELTSAANVVFDMADALELDAKAPADVPIRWFTEGDNDDVFVDVSIGDISVTCLFDSAQGTGTIPAALVKELTTDASAECTPSTCRVLMASRRQRTIAVGDWAVVLTHGIATMREIRVIR